MKKIQASLVCIISVFVMTLAGTATAYNSSFTHICYAADPAPTINGQYTAGEWGSGASVPFGTNGVFRTCWTMSPVTYASFVVETWDTTNDPGDYFEICFDSTATGTTTEPNGGTAPQTDDFKIVITGHDSPTIQWYKGTGTAWAAIATPTAFSDVAVFQQAQSLSASSMYATPHYIWEMHIDKTNTVALGIVLMGYNWAQYIAYYDAHTGGYGLQSWPPSPAADTNPNSWGYVPYSMDAAPEGFNVGIILALTSVAVIAGALIIKRAPISKYVTA